MDTKNPEMPASLSQPTDGNKSDGILLVQESVVGVTENQTVAESLNEIASLLSEQGANEFRVRAYRNAAKTLTSLGQPVSKIVESRGIEGLIALPAIGPSIAGLIAQFVRVGRIGLLDRLRGEDTAEHLFATLPNIGPRLARRIHEHLEIETLPELFAAAIDGRLEQVPGFGSGRVRAVRECLIGRLRHDPAATEVTSSTQPDQSVSIVELLSIDAEYRRRVAANDLVKIAPRRFNPGSVAWLPILHTEREDRHYTALFSNTARAHQLNTTRDWVVIYRDDPQIHSRWTIITSQFGKLKGRRIVRGREQECAQHYFHSEPPPTGPTEQG